MIYHCDGCNCELAEWAIHWREPHTQEGIFMAPATWRFCARCAVHHDNGRRREDDRANWADELLPDEDDIPF